MHRCSEVESVQSFSEPQSGDFITARPPRLVVGTVVGSWDWDVRADRVTWSEQLELVFGLDRAAFAGTYEAYVALVHPDDREKVDRTVQECLSGAMDTYAVEHRAIGADGTTRWIENAGYVERDASGRAVRMTGTVVDVTRRRETEEELRASEALLEQLIRATPAAVAVLDRDLRYLQVSERWLTQYGLEGRDIVGRHHYHVFPALSERCKRTLSRALAGSVERCDEDPVPMPDGGVEWLRWEVQPFRNAEGEIGGVILFTEVITERKRAEAERTRLTHELRERVKELTLVHQTARLLQSDRLLGKELLSELVVLMPRAWQYPEICEARIRYAGVSVQTPGFRETEWRQSATFTVSDGSVGQLDVVYLAERPAADEGPFSAEERSVLQSLAEMLCVHVERVNAQAELVRSEQKFASIFLATPVGLVISRAADCLLYDVNREFERILGYVRHDVVGKTAFELGLWVEPDVQEEYVRRVVSQGSVERLEASVRCADGRVLPLSISGQLLDIGGEPYVLSAFVDLSERHRAEMAIRESEARLRRVIASPMLGIGFGRRADRVVMDCNDEYLRITGYTREEVQAGKLTYDALTPPEFAAITAHGLEQAVDVGMSRPWEMEVLRKDGERVPVLVGVSTIEDERTLDVGFLVDLSERRALERQLHKAQRLEAVGRLAAGTAHDFNNVLTVITMCCELLREDLKCHPSSSEVAEIHEAAERAVGLTRQLLAFSRQQILDPRVIDLNDLLTNLEKMLRRLLGQGIELAFELAPKLGAVKADPGQIEQVLINLAINGRDAMAEGGTLTISTSDVRFDAAHRAEHVCLSPGAYVVVSVTDTGAGMSAATRSRLFEPFFTTKEQGTGLGLSTALGIVQQSGGAIEVESEPGRGSTFRVFLPRVEERLDLGPERTRPEAVGGSETLLLVEDDPAVRQITRKILRRLGYQVLEAAGPQAARQLVHAHQGPIDLLLTDVIMPGGGGRKLATELVALRPNLRVLYMSGYTDDTAMKQNGLGPSSAYVQKPFSSETLATKLRAVLDA